MTYSQTASRDLREKMLAGDYGDFPLDIVLDWLMGFLRTLLDCQPTPEDAVDYLTWRPWLPFWRERRIAAHRDTVARRMQSAGVCSPLHTAAVCNALFDAVDDGLVTVGRMRGLYREVGYRG